MKKTTDKTMVLIDIPRFCVPVKEADEFLQMAIKFWNDVKITMIESKIKRIKYDTYYAEGNLIPTIKFQDSYTDILGDYVNVDELNSYIELNVSDKYIDKEEILQLWNPESKEEE